MYLMANESNFLHANLFSSKSLEAKFEQYTERFSHLFRRTEPRTQMAKYMKALLTPIDRKNGWQIAQAIGDQLPDSTQRLLYLSRWDADMARDILQQVILEELSHPEGVAVLGEVGFYKKGNASIGVQRQRNPSTGRRENCQIAPMLCYATPRGSVLFDRQIYLPEHWTHDAKRMRRAKVPPSVSYQTRADLSATMLRCAWQQRMPIQWVVGNLTEGNNRAIFEAARQCGYSYVLSTDGDTPVFMEDANGEGAQRNGSTAATQSTMVEDVVYSWPSTRWQRLHLPIHSAADLIDSASGSSADLADEAEMPVYQWGRERISENIDGRPGAQGWLIARRNLAKPRKVTYFLSNASARTSLRSLARLAMSDRVFRQCVNEARVVAGLDDYEVRHWHSWHRHITLAMMAYAFAIIERNNG